MIGPARGQTDTHPEPGASPKATTNRQQPRAWSVSSGPNSVSEPIRIPQPTFPLPGSEEPRRYQPTQADPDHPISQCSTNERATQGTFAPDRGMDPHDSHREEPMLLRKEVIQPHLPVRLPCYDFVPIASPTFDRSPQTSWLGHGLRVLPTFVT